MEQELRRLPDGTYTGAMTDEHICGIFGCCGDWNRREVRIGALTVYVYAIDGITSGGDASEYVVKPLMQDAFGGTMDELYDRALHRTVYNSVAVPCGDLQSTAERLVNGFTVVLFGQRAIAFETKTGEKRSPSAPEVENTVKGPKDAFTETVRTNTSLLRRHLRTPALRLYETVVGQRSLTNVTLAWIDGLTEPALVSRMQARLAEIDIDGLLTPAAVEEYLTGSRPTAFPLLQYTERTDRFAQALLEGRAGLLVDGLPLGYLAPVDLGYLMTSAEDRGTDFVSASFLRVLRYAALLLGLLLPGLYVAMAAFHPQMLPTELLQSILEASAQCRSRPSWRCSGCWPPLSCCRRQASRCRSPWGRAFPSSAALSSARRPWRRGSSRPRPSSSWRRRASAALPYRGAALQTPCAFGGWRWPRRRALPGCSA